MVPFMVVSSLTVSTPPQRWHGRRCVVLSGMSWRRRLNCTHCPVRRCPLLSARSTSSSSMSGIAGCWMALCLRPNALYALSLVSDCRIRAARIRDQGRQAGRPWPPVRPPSPDSAFATNLQAIGSLLNVQHVPGGYYPFAVNPPTSRVCGSLSWELWSRRERSISFFAGGVAQRGGTTLRSAQ